MPLSTTFRCPTRVVEEARKIVPDIEAKVDSPAGKVDNVSLEQAFQGFEYGDFVLSRTNAPLVKLAMKLVSDGCRTTILGREIGSGLISLIYKLKAFSVADLLMKLEAHRVKEQSRLMAKDPPRESAAKLIGDKVECIKAIAKQCRSVDEVVTKLKQLFEKLDPKTCVTLATAHKAKGLERDRVWLLNDTFCRPNRLGVVSTEEKNILYVAITRAKSELTYVKGLP